MPRKFLDDIKTTINNLFVEGGKLRIEQEHKPLIIDIIDSLKQDEGGIFGDVRVEGISVTSTYSILETIFTDQIGGAPGFIIPDEVAGVVAVSPIAGYTYTVYATLSFEGSNNDQFDFSVFMDGSPIGVGESTTGKGTGNDRPMPINIRTGTLSAPADAEFSIGVKSPDGNSNINIIKASIFVVVEPTNNP